jgi:hypothetical protein
MQEESKNVSLTERDEMLDVFALFASHPFLPVGARGLRGSSRVQLSIVFLLSFNKEEQHATTY